MSFALADVGDSDDEFVGFATNEAFTLESWALEVAADRPPSDQLSFIKATLAHLVGHATLCAAVSALSTHPTARGHPVTVTVSDWALVLALVPLVLSVAGLTVTSAARRRSSGGSGSKLSVCPCDSLPSVAPHVPLFSLLVSQACAVSVASAVGWSQICPSICCSLAVSLVIVYVSGAGAMVRWMSGGPGASVMQPRDVGSMGSPMAARSVPGRSPGGCFDTVMCAPSYDREDEECGLSQPCAGPIGPKGACIRMAILSILPSMIFSGLFGLTLEAFIPVAIITFFLVLGICISLVCVMEALPVTMAGATAAVEVYLDIYLITTFRYVSRMLIGCVKGVPAADVDWY